MQLGRLHLQQLDHQVNVPVPVNELQQLSAILDTIGGLTQMADPISLLSSVIAISGAGIEISKQLLSFAAAWRGCGEEIVYLGQDLHAFSMVLVEVHEWLSDNQAVISIRALESANAILQHCQQIFKSIRKMIGPFDKPDPRTFWPKLKWKFDRERVAPLRARLEGFKSTLTLLLSTMKLAKVKDAQKAPGSKLILRPKVKLLRGQVEEHIRANTIALGHLHFIEDIATQTSKSQKALTYDVPSESLWLEKLMPFFERPSLMPYPSYPLLLGQGFDPGHSFLQNQKLEKRKMNKAVGVLLAEWTTLNDQRENIDKSEEEQSTYKSPRLPVGADNTSRAKEQSSSVGLEREKSLLESGTAKTVVTCEDAPPSPASILSKFLDQTIAHSQIPKTQDKGPKHQTRLAVSPTESVEKGAPDAIDQGHLIGATGTKHDTKAEKAKRKSKLPHPPASTQSSSSSSDSEDSAEGFLQRNTTHSYIPPHPFSISSHPPNITSWSGTQPTPQYGPSPSWPLVDTSSSNALYQTQVSSQPNLRYQYYTSMYMPGYHQPQALDPSAGFSQFGPDPPIHSSVNPISSVTDTMTDNKNTIANGSLPTSTHSTTYFEHDSTNKLDGQLSLARMEYVKALQEAEQSRLNLVGSKQQSYRREQQSVKVNTLSNFSEQHVDTHRDEIQAIDVAADVTESYDEGGDSTDEFDYSTTEGEDDGDPDNDLRAWKRRMRRRVEKYRMRAEVLDTAQAAAWAEEKRAATARREAEIQERIRNEIELEVSERDRALREAREKDAVIYFTNQRGDKFTFPFLRARSWPEMLKLVRKANDWPENVVEDTEIRVYDSSKHQILSDLWECSVKSGTTYSSALNLNCDASSDDDIESIETSRSRRKQKATPPIARKPDLGSAEKTGAKRTVNSLESRNNLQNSRQAWICKSGSIDNSTSPQVPFDLETHKASISGGETSSTGSQIFVPSVASGKVPPEASISWHQFFQDMEPQLQQAINIEHNHAITRTKKRLAKLMLDKSIAEYHKLGNDSQYSEMIESQITGDSKSSELSQTTSKVPRSSGFSRPLSGQEGSSCTDPVIERSSYELPPLSTPQRHLTANNLYMRSSKTQHSVNDPSETLVPGATTSSSPVTSTTTLQQQIEYVTHLLRQKEALDTAMSRLADEKKLKLLEEQLLASPIIRHTATSDDRPNTRDTSLHQTETKSQSSSRRGKSAKLKSIRRILVGRSQSTNDI